MRKLKQLLTVILLCGLLACTGLAFVSAEDEPLLGPNLMPNGSFENAIPASANENEYELQWGAKVYTAADENDGNVRSGSKSIVLENKVGQDHVPFARTTLLTDDITADSEYELSMYVKAVGYRGYTYLRVFYNADQSARVDSQDIHFANNESNEEGEWVKLTYRFTLNATFGAGTQTVGFRFVLFEGQVTQDGSLYLDDIELRKVLQPGEITPGITLDVGVSTDLYNPLPIAFGKEIVLPAPTATYMDASGQESDVSAQVKGTLTWGETGDTVIRENVAADEAGRTFTPDNHGYYQYTYTVEHEGQTASATLYMQVQDTLQSIAVDPSQKSISIEQGSDFDFSSLKVTKMLSYSGENTAAPEEISVADYGGFNKDELGTYTVTVQVSADYYQHTVKATDTVEVTVAEVGSVDLSRIELEVITESAATPQIAWQVPYTFPDVSAKGYDSEGNETDIHDLVKVTVQYGLATATSTTWTDVEGYADLPISEANRTYTPDHGYWRMKYEVTWEGKTAEIYSAADVMDTLLNLRVESEVGSLKIHQGDTPNLDALTVIAEYSYTGERHLYAESYTVDYGEFNEQSGVGQYTATIKVEQVLSNTTITKTATFVIEVVADDVEIDYSSVRIITDREEDNIPNALPYTAPDVTVIATDKDGNPVDLHDQVTVTFQHTNTDTGISSDIPGYVDLPISERTFVASMHGYCRVVYRVEYEGKTAEAIIRLNIMDTLHGISVNTEYVDTRITKGEDLDLSRLIVTKQMSYTGEQAVEAGAYTVDFGDFDKNVPGEYTITITYGEVYGGEYEAEFTVEVRDVIVSFTVTTYPSRTEFSYGEEFDLNGIAAEVVFETLGKQDVASSEIEIRGYSPRTVGTQTVEFYYDGVKGGEMTVTVLDAFYAVVLDLENVKLTYQSGEALDLTGLKVYQVMMSGSRTELTAEQYTVDSSNFKAGEAGTYTITVNAEIDGVTRGASFDVTVEAGGGCNGGCGGAVTTGLPGLGVVLLLGCLVVLIKKKRA